jgi:hypothetical protein
MVRRTARAMQVDSKGSVSEIWINFRWWEIQVFYTESNGHIFGVASIALSHQRQRTLRHGTDNVRVSGTEFNDGTRCNPPFQDPVSDMKDECGIAPTRTATPDADG